MDITSELVSGKSLFFSPDGLRRLKSFCRDNMTFAACGALYILFIFVVQCGVDYMIQCFGFQVAKSTGAGEFEALFPRSLTLLLCSKKVEKTLCCCVFTSVAGQVFQ